MEYFAYNALYIQNQVISLNKVTYKNMDDMIIHGCKTKMSYLNVTVFHNQINIKEKPVINIGKQAWSPNIALEFFYKVLARIKMFMMGKKQCDIKHT